MERSVLLCRGESIGTEHLPMHSSAPCAGPAVGDPVSLEAIEEAHIRRIVASAGNLDKAAAVLGMNPATLWRRRKKYGL